MVAEIVEYELAEPWKGFLAGRGRHRLMVR